MDTPLGRISIDESGTCPVLIEGRVLLPVRAIVEQMDGFVEWNPYYNELNCHVDGYDVRMRIGDNIYYVDGEEYVFDVPPRIVNGSTLIPARDLFEAIGCEVTWEENIDGGWDRISITYRPSGRE